MIKFNNLDVVLVVKIVEVWVQEQMLMHSTGHKETNFGPINCQNWHYERKEKQLFKKLLCMVVSISCI